MIYFELLFLIYKCLFFSSDS